MNTPSEDQQRALALEVLRAEHGDCLLLTYGRDLVLIDGGPPGVYDATLKPRLQELIGERDEPLFLRMVMVSHIDDDHIVGLADMFSEARERKEEQRGPAEWRTGELWLNAFGALTGAGRSAGASGIHGAAMEALVDAAPGAQSEAVAASVANGIALQQDAIGLGVEINKSFGGGLVQVGGDSATIEVAPDLTFTVIAPAEERLTKLQEKWEAWVRNHPRADAQTAANLDRSVFNLSSIVVLARSGGRSLLLTGDAGSDDMLQGLKAAGLLADAGPPLAVDVLKLPHHGSIRNVDATPRSPCSATHAATTRSPGRSG